jgi:putative sigma-54 modulation protein
MTVDVVVLGRHVDVPAGVRDHTVAMLQRVEKFAPDVRRVDVDYIAPHNGTRARGNESQCEILVHLTKHLVKGTATGVDQRTALDRAFARVEEQMRRLHERRTDRRNGRSHRARRNGGPAVDALADAAGAGSTGADVEPLFAPDDEADEGFRVVRAKQFEVKPMVAEEAALQMELLGHDFFLFTSAESGRAAVIYRRRDGSFGLIEATG